MSAHTSSEKSSSVWSFISTSIGILIAVLTVYWSLALLNGQRKQIFKSNEGAAEAPSATVVAAVPSESPAAAETAPAPAENAAATVAAPAPAAAPAEASGDVAEITIKPDAANPLAYDTKAFSVKAGQTVKLTFDNKHPTVPQPHNVVIGVPGSKDKLLAAAMQMAADPQGMAKGYIPETPDILFHTKLLQPNQVEVLEFTAPAVGEYPYLCTFPGHGMIMNGIMTVE